MLLSLVLLQLNQVVLAQINRGIRIILRGLLLLLLLGLSGVDLLAQLVHNLLLVVLMRLPINSASHLFKLVEQRLLFLVCDWELR